MAHTIRKTTLVVLALGAIAFGASALAGAASNKSSTSPTQGSAAQAQRPPDGDGGPGGRPAGPHVGANGQRETPLTDGTATKVREAALAKVSGTVERVETDVDFGS